MAASPQFKVFHEDQYIAAFKHLLDAAQFISLEDGREVRLGHSARGLIWRNDPEWTTTVLADGPATYTGDEVCESYDVVLSKYYEIYPHSA